MPLIQPRVLSLLTLALPAALAASSGLVATRQDPSRVAHVQLMNSSSGAVVAESELSFSFSWPYVQMTADAAAGTTYLTAFPDGASYPSLFVLDRDLVEIARLEQADFTWWDLQSAPLQDTLYGIMVTQDFNGGMYGRTLSNYTYRAAEGALWLEPQQLYTLPYMWYVNASSFDQASNTYFALINNFPGHENSTTDQKLAVCAFGEPMGTADPADGEEAVLLLDLDLGDVMAQFVAFSGATGELFFSGPSKVPGVQSVTVGVVCQEHGKVERVLFEGGGVSAVGPLVADDAQRRLLFFVQRASDGCWDLMAAGYAGVGPAELVATYSPDDYRSVAAAVQVVVA